jgi:type IV fimbrial biogenesis protein FimT
MNRKSRHLGSASCGGFTLIELISVVLVLALIATLAAPSFTRMLAKKRVEGIASELVTDLQYARSEAVQRNDFVRITFGPRCYVIHTAGINGAATCSSNGPSTVGVPETELKTVQLPGASTVSLSPNGGLAFVDFDPQRGFATCNGVSSPCAPGSVSVTSGEWQLSALVYAVGRVRTCSPNSSISGYSNDCS